MSSEQRGHSSSPHLSMNPDLAPPQLDRQAATSRRRIDRTADHTVKFNANGNPIKRRSWKACQCCRVRKVKCDVVERGVPCTNCTMDEVLCVVTKSKWRKDRRVYNANPQETTSGCPQLPVHELSGSDGSATGSLGDDTTPASRRVSTHGFAMDTDDGHRFNAHIADPSNRSEIVEPNRHDDSQDSFLPTVPPDQLLFESKLLNSVSFCGDLFSSHMQTLPTPPQHGDLPAYIKPLPDRMMADDVHHIWKKDALSIPETALRNELMRCYIDYVYPYMPAIELHKFLHIVDQNNGEDGKISLLLFQAIMFAGTAFADRTLLKTAGYMSHKAARKAFYQKVRVLYDSDYEVDRVAIVQSLLLMTYWYENPDDQKDTWHWMGIAISLAHTVGLHRNPEQSHMNIEKQHLWRRLWWSCFMRDQLVALGLSRSTRIKDGDYDIPMLTLEDFDIRASSAHNISILTDCTFIEDTILQTDLAMMCIAKAKLCLCLGHVLSTRYCDLVRDQGTAQQDITRANFMLFPEKMHQIDKTQLCDAMLREWKQGLPAHCLYITPSTEEVARAGTSFIVQRALLHMVYFATVSALQRLQVRHTSQKAQKASQEISKISFDLLNLKLEQLLPTSSLTVLLPASMVHLLAIKSNNNAIRKEALQGFCHCAQVMEELRDKYCAADYAIRFLEAAIRKADLDIVTDSDSSQEDVTFPDKAKMRVQNISQLIDLGRAESRGKQGSSADYIEGNPAHAPSFESINDLYGTEFNLDSFLNMFGAGNNMDFELWEDTVEGVMNCESGGFLMNLN